jgi:hypothetical protein
MVTESMTTSHAGGPGILTAPAMIMEMEITAVMWRSFLPLTTPPGYEIRSDNCRPTGRRVVPAAAELLEVEGRRLLFASRHNAREDR